MRVLEPHYFRQHKKAKPKKLSKKHRLLITGMLVASVLAVGYVLFGQELNPGSPRPANRENNSTETAPTEEKPKTLKQFTAEQFKNSYSSYRYPNTEPITDPPTITGNEAADARIRQIAEKRGYKLTSRPVASIVKTEEPGLEGDDLIQPNALIAWQQLKNAAIKDGITLKLTSAYRSIEYQRTLFLRRMQANGVNVARVLEGFADDEIEAILSRAALPGYSRHHTGYTIDLSCNGVGLEAFRGTACYAWLSKNNFENVKKFGWVPSYPEGVGDVGPEPESWEYVWVGTNATYE